MRGSRIVQYPFWLDCLQDIYGKTERTIRRWYLKSVLQVNTASIPYSFSWIKWQIEMNRMDPEQAVIEAPYGLDNIVQKERCWPSSCGIVG